MFKRLYDQDFRDFSDDKEEFSVEDQVWLNDVKSTVKKDDEGHFEIALPAVQVERIPDSFPTAERRLRLLRNRFKRDPDLA